MNSKLIYPEGPISKSDLGTLSQILDIYQNGGSPYEVECRKVWVEKLIRLVEINRRKLPEVYQDRFGQNRSKALKITFQILTATSRLNAQKNHIPYPDFRALNAALYLRDSSVMKKLIHSDAICKKTEDQLMVFIRELPQLLQDRGSARWCDELALKPTFVHQEKQTKKDLNGEGFLVLCPNPYSLNTIATLWVLKMRGAKVSALAIRRMASFKRIREELAFSPRRFVTRVLNEIIFRGSKKVSSDAASLTGLMESLNCNESSAISLAKSMGAEILQVDDFNSRATTKIFKQQPAKYAIFTGGGIIQKGSLSAFDGGIIHCHPGILPQYKGMDVVQWAILEGSFDQVGSTCQIMSADIDGGRIIDNFFVDPRGFSSIQAVRTAVVEQKVKFVVDTAIDLASGQRTSIPPPFGGKQYFLMHSILDNICAKYQETVVSKML